MNKEPITPAAFQEYATPFLALLREVPKAEFQAFLQREVRFPVAVKPLTDGSEWYLYWREPDVLAAACHRPLVDGELVPDGTCFISA